MSNRTFTQDICRGILMFLVVSTGLIIGVRADADSTPRTLTLDARLFNPASPTTPLADNALLVNVKIMNPGKTCILYEENQTVTTAADGRFNIQLGSAAGSAKRGSSDPNNAMSFIFQNAGHINATNPGCASGYTPTAADLRYARITLTPSSTGVAEMLSPDTVIDSVPSALVADTLQGLDASQFLQLGSPTTLSQTNVANVFSATNYPKLSSLLTGSSTDYMRTTTGNGASLPSLATTPASPAAGQIWFDSTSGGVKYYDGTQTKALSSGSNFGATLTNAKFWVGNGSNVPTEVAASGDVTLTNTGAFTVAKLRGANVSATLPSADGQVLRYSNGGTQYVPAYLSMADIRSSITPGNTAFPATSCSASNSLSWSSLTDSFTCAPIAISETQVGYATRAANAVFAGPATGPAAVPTFRALTLADLPAGASSQWSLASGNLYFASGTVGIGTSASSAGSILNIAGSGTAASSIMIPRDTSANRPTGANGMLRYNTTLNSFEGFANGGWSSFSASPWNVNSGNLSYSAGNVGVGTSSPGAALHLYNASAVEARLESAGAAYLTLNSSANYIYSNSVLNLQTQSAAPLVLGTNASERVRIDSAGKVGIGTASPASLLDVNGAVHVAGILDAQGTNITGTGTTVYPSASVNAYTVNGVGEFVANRYRGTVAAPTAVLDQDFTGQIVARGYNGTQLEDTANMTMAVDGTDVSGSGNHPGGRIDFNVRGTSSLQYIAGAVMSIRNSGKVGIGTANPAYTLDVNGTARASQICINTDCRSVWPAAGGSGTVTTVSSANADIAVASAATAPVLTLNSGTSANQIVKLNASSQIPAVDGSLLTNVNAAKLSGASVTLTTLASGNYLRYNGTAWVNAIPVVADLSDASTLIKASQMPANCTASQTLTFTSPTNTWSCSTITVAATSITGTLPVANGGTGSTAGNITGSSSLNFTAGGTTQNVNLLPSDSGNVGIGYNLPSSTLYVRSSTPGVSSGAVTVSGSSGAILFTMSAAGPTINPGDYLVPTTSTAQARFVISVSGTTVNTDQSQPLTAAVTGESFTIYRPISTMLSGATPKIQVQGYTGRLGIGTRYPQAAVDANTGIVNQNNTGVRGIVSVTHTVNGAYLDTGMQFTGIEKIPSGVTDSGLQVGASAGFLRNYGTTGDSGTLTEQRGFDSSYGHFNSDSAATPQTTKVIGINLLPYTQTGTISNMYDVLLNSTVTGTGSALNHWGIYQADANVKNTFFGKVGIGSTAPAYILDVVGTARVSADLLVPNLPNSASGTYVCYFNGKLNYGTSCTGSDIRLKKDVEPIVDSLDKILKLDGAVTWYWKDELRGTSKNMGLIAQDVIKQFPEAVSQNTDGFYNLKYDVLVAPLISAVKTMFTRWSEDSKALHADLLAKEARIETLERENREVREALCAKDSSFSFCARAN